MRRRFKPQNDLYEGRGKTCFVFNRYNIVFSMFKSDLVPNLIVLQCVNLLLLLLFTFSYRHLNVNVIKLALNVLHYMLISK